MNPNMKSRVQSSKSNVLMEKPAEVSSLRAGVLI